MDHVLQKLWVVLIHQYNFNELANVNDNSCQPVILGCTDINSHNYNLCLSWW